MGKFSPFVLHVLDDRFVVEPPLDLDSGACLSFTQHAGKSPFDPLELAINTETRSGVLTERCRRLSVHAILGFFSFLRGSYIAAVTRSRVIGHMHNGAVVRQIQHVDLLPIPVATKDAKVDLTPEQWQAEAGFLRMVHDVIDTQSFYFSQRYDLTNTAQRIATTAQELNNLTDSQRADARFFWNRHLLAPLIKHNFHHWVQPVICGHVEIHSDIQADGVLFDYVFIARRSCSRQGTRFNVRGIDDDGCAANFVESEQMLLPSGSSHYFDADSEKRVFLLSYVQTRGSIPLSWSQKVTLKYMPRTKITATADSNRQRFEKHFGPVTSRSGEHSLDTYDNVVAVNLIDRTGSSNAVKDQRELGQLYKKQCDMLNDDRLRYVWFDFHHECRKMKWFNLSKLLDDVKPDLEKQQFFVQAIDGSVLQLQNGIFRTNCMDNLDRTNVVQSLFARRVALMQLGYLVDRSQSHSSAQVETLKKSIAGSDVLNSPFHAFEYIFKNVWANNADAMSVLYSGTPALKTDFTRTGKRTKRGLLQDGYNSVMRYYINNFQDGYRQDAVDLFLGKVAGVNSKENFPRYKDGNDTLSTLLTQFAALFAFLFALVVSLFGVSFLKGIVVSSLVFTTIGALGANRVLKKGLDSSFGNKLINRPQFRVNAV